MDNGTCKGCKAPILWVHTDNGKKMPLDPDPVKRVVLFRVSRDKTIAKIEDTYMPHFATCPKAKQFKKNNS